VREVMPLIIFISYNTNKKFYPNNKYFVLFTIPYLLFSLYSLIMYFLGHNAKELWGFWTIEAPISWGITLIVLLIVINDKIKNIPYAVTLSYFMVNAGGYIYEIPLFIERGGLLSIIRCSNNYPLFLSSQIVSIFIVYILLRDKEFRINKLIVASFIIYIIYVIVYLRTGYLGILSHSMCRWFYRIPCILLLLSLSMGLVKVKEIENKKGQKVIKI